MTEADQPHHVDCCIIIITYNSARYIDDLLNSLPAAADCLTVRIVVVDNGSTDDTLRRVRDHHDVCCVEAGANLGYAGGINIGRRHAGLYGVLAVLNPDLVLEPGALSKLFKALNDPAVGVAVPMLLDFHGNRTLSLRQEPTLTTQMGDALFGDHFKRRPRWMSDVVRDEREYTYSHSVDWASGAVMVISAACDRVVGAWDERFFLYMEEVDYAARVRAVGLRVVYEPRARVRHRGAGSGRSQATTALMGISRIRYFEKRGKTVGILRALVLLSHFLRIADPGHRAAMRTVSRRSAWDPLISGLKTRGAEPDLGPPEGIFHKESGTFTPSH